MAKGQGWHGDSRGHSKAARGEKPTNTQGWYGDSEGHAKAAKGESVKSKSFWGKLRGK